jgi:hypothetical protein
MRKFEADFDLDRNTDEADPRDAFEASAIRDFKAACGDLLRAGFCESDLVALIEESLPMAEEVEFTLTIPGEPPPF